MKLHFFDDAPNYQVAELVREPLEAYFAEVRELLPELPEKLSIWLDNSWLTKQTGTGGAAYSADIINISFDADFADKQAQLADLRGTVFHEAYHLVQGHTFIGPKAEYRTMLDSAIYEGCATVFEREYAGVVPLWGEYKQHSREELVLWRNAMKAISIEEFRDGSSKLWSKWAYYDKGDAQRWKAYKTGSWVVDEAIERSYIDILEMRKMSSTEILKK